MTHLYYDKDADLSLLQTKRVAVLGYGSQGHAHALNLHDNGVPVRVGLRTNSESVTHANQAGLRVQTVAEQTTKHHARHRCYC